MLRCQIGPAALTIAIPFALAGVALFWISMEFFPHEFVSSEALEASAWIGLIGVACLAISVVLGLVGCGSICVDSYCCR